jgi:hypothetical protein
MKFLDKVLREWRVRKALRAMPAGPTAVFDIGCDDGYLLGRMPAGVRREGCEPLAERAAEANGDRIFTGFFPEAVVGAYQPATYDAIYALAVFEHFQADDLQRSSPVIADMLSDRGRLIATVPHPFVDKILHVLMFLRLIHGQEAHQHHGFDPRTLADEMPDLRLVKRRTFQFGLNYLFVFERASPRSADA